MTIQRRKRKMSNVDQTTQMLILLLACAGIILFVLIIVYFVLKAKDKKSIDVVGDADMFAFCPKFAEHQPPSKSQKMHKGVVIQSING